MANPNRGPLSGSTKGKLIPVTITASIGTTVHTAAAGHATTDYVTLTANNTTASPVLLTVEKGATGAQTDQIVTNVLAQVGMTTILDRSPLQSALAITAYAASSAAINLDGWYDRY